VLAYVFSHRAAASFDRAPYEEALRRFHDSLASASPPGFVSSRTYRMGDRYSDWYLVWNSAALDALNEAAVTGSRSSPHDAAARMASDFAGKLLSLVTGSLPAGRGYEIRFSKPAGISYTELYSQLEAWTQRPGVSLWRRMMVLGPPPEFCLVADSEIGLPEDMGPEVVEREPI
jgi:hypothetical protein